MEIGSKELSAIVKSMRKNLAAHHNVEVPSSALRAVLLQALGENPHAFSTRPVAQSKPVPAPGAVMLKSLAATAVVPPYSPERRKLYLAPNSSGEMGLSFDEDGVYSFELTEPMSSIKVFSMHSYLPNIVKYGIPDYIQDPIRYFESCLQLCWTPGAHNTFVDLGDDSGSYAELWVEAPEEAWEQLLNTAFEENESFDNDLAEWVGLHYAVNFSAETTARKLEWAGRYVAAIQQA